MQLLVIEPRTSERPDSALNLCTISLPTHIHSLFVRTLIFEFHLPNLQNEYAANISLGVHGTMETNLLQNIGHRSLPFSSLIN